MLGSFVTAKRFNMARLEHNCAGCMRLFILLNSQAWTANTAKC